MTAVVSSNGSLQPFDDPSQPTSQASSPTSPTLSSYSQTRPSNGTASGSSSHASTPPPSSALEPPPGMSYSDFLRTWSDAHVARWLTDIKCGQHARTFQDSDIRGDVLLELDQLTLKEMNITSVGDRLRVLNAVKSLRHRCSPSHAALASILNRPRGDDHTRTPSSGLDGSASRAHHRRLESARPAPLHLTPAGSPDLPRIIRDGQDSTSATRTNNIRPLPQPGNASSTHSTPTTSHSVRANLPPLPPPPRGQPPLPPNPRTPHNLLSPHGSVSGRRTPVQPEASPYSPSQNFLTPTSQTSGGGRTPHRSQSPLPFPPMQSNNTGRHTPPNGVHNRSGSYSNATSSNPSVKLPPRPSTGNTHPFAHNNAQNGLSPIAESFMSQRNATPSPPSVLQRVGSLMRPNTPSQNTQAHTGPSLDDLKRKLVKFTMSGEAKSVTINVEDCTSGVDVILKALRKFNKLAKGIVITEDGRLSVDGWGAYMYGQDDVAPLTEARLLSICNSPPDDPSRENGFTLRRIPRLRGSPTSREPTPSPTSPVFAAHEQDNDEDFLPPDLPSTTTKAMKRASSVSILSSLGVSIPDKMSDSAMTSPSTSTSQGLSPTKTAASTRRPSKLRNFFGQRPPSELITTHLAEYFPFTEKKVLERTRRQSMMRAAGANTRRDSVVSWNAPAHPRFSVSTLGSGRGVSSRMSVSSASTLFPDRPASPPPPLPTAPSPAQAEAASEQPEDTSAPRLSLVTDDGDALDLAIADEPANDDYKRLSSPHVLPPVAFPSESLSDALNLEPELSLAQRRESRRLSVASRRMSYITELRSKRDRSDTASLVTVDEITASVESRRENGKTDSDGSEEWTQVDVSESPEKASIMEMDEEDEDEDEDEETDEDEDEDEDETVEGAMAEEDETGKTITSTGRERTIKWTKGALIGAGSFGKVYLGLDVSTGLLMAVKQVELPTGSAPNEYRKKNMLDALEHEIELLRELQHENIVQYLSSCIDDDHLNIFLEYVPGGSVTSLLRNYGAFEETLVRNWVRQILLGLNYLHERDIIHRDIKGANILVDNKGGIKISDFGISKKVEDNLLPGNRAHRPSLQGSVFWMAPEVVKQTTYTQKADIWSVGCLVVEMLTGEHPWAQLTQMQAIFKIGSLARPAIPADISPEAENFLQLTFELNHEARPSAAELLKHPWITNQSLPLAH